MNYLLTSAGIKNPSNHDAPADPGVVGFSIFPHLNHEMLSYPVRRQHEVRDA